jgi:hypothetical protein
MKLHFDHEIDAQGSKLNALCITQMLVFIKCVIHTLVSIAIT